VHSLFLGGGTPSLFSARAIDAILAAARARLALAADAEITLEANPGTVEADKFRDFAAAGVNRLSLGIQSFDPRHLRSLGRIHDGDQARRAVDVAQRHFSNVNLDLMYGLPAQTPEEALADVETALGYAPAHLSCYHLTIEPNTYFHRFPPQLPDDDATSAMQDAIEARLEAAGYEHYEVSAYARRREEKGERREEQERSDSIDASLLSPLASHAGYCRHNLNYWTFGDYLGIGAGAHGKISFPDRITREARVRHPERYLEAAEGGNPVDARHEVASADLGFEFMMNALRLTGGFPSRLFEERAGIPLLHLRKELDEAERRGLIERDHRRIAPTRLGRRFLNDLLQLFLRDREQPAALIEFTGSQTGGGSR
jgi:oxygen-independent coproporphyrinogen-3 oxidase